MKKLNKIELALLNEESRSVRKEIDELKAELLSDTEKSHLESLDKRARDIEIKLINYKNSPYEKTN